MLGGSSLLLLHFGSGIEEFQQLDPDPFQLTRVRA